MNNVSTLKDMARLILLAGLTCGIVGFVHAQAGAGGAAGGAGQAGTGSQAGGGMSGGMTAPSPGSGSATTSQSGNSSPGQNMPGKKGSSRDSSKNPGSGQLDNRRGWGQTLQRYREPQEREPPLALEGINLR